MRDFADKKILVIGELILDEYLQGDVSRISPEAPVPVVHFQNERLLLGGAGNVVRNLKALGIDASVLSVLGIDSYAKDIQDLLDDIHIPKENRYIFSSKTRPTIRKIRVMTQNQQLCRIDYEDIVPSTEEEKTFILEKLEACIPNIDGIIISDYDKGLLTPEIIKKTIQLAQKSNLFISVDPQIRNFPYYMDVDLLSPNLHEFSKSLGVDLDSREKIVNYGKCKQADMRIRNLLITQGADGMTLFSKQKENEVKVEHFPTEAREVFDVTGAGDTVITLMTLGLMSGWPIAESIRIANLGAGLVVKRLGAASVSASELANALNVDVSKRKRKE